MVNPFRRSTAAQRPALRPVPGTQPFEVDSDGLEVSEGNDESDWELWEDSVQTFDSGVMPIDPFDRVRKNDG